MSIKQNNLMVGTLVFQSLSLSLSLSFLFNCFWSSGGIFLLHCYWKSHLVRVNNGGNISAQLLHCKQDIQATYLNLYFTCQPIYTSLDVAYLYRVKFMVHMSNCLA